MIAQGNDGSPRYDVGLVAAKLGQAIQDSPTQRVLSAFESVGQE
jgi:hypothetical protein